MSFNIRERDTSISRDIHLADTLFKLENNMYLLVQLSSKEYIEKVKLYYYEDITVKQVNYREKAHTKLSKYSE